jgi:metal iron transporter
LDVFVVLAVFNSYPNETRNKSITAFEILISVMVLTVLSSFVVLIVRLSPDWSDVFDGYLPSSAVVGPGALYISVGIIGATVMPHALFLGAKLGTIRRIEDHEAYSGDEEDANKVIDKDLGSGLDSTEMTGLSNRAQRSPRTNATHRARSGTNAHMHAPSLHMPQPTRMPQYPLKELPKTERSAKFIRIHLHHAQLDIGYSLFCFALVTNSAILTVAGAAFYYREGTEDTSGVQEGDLFSAHELIKTRVGTGQ